MCSPTRSRSAKRYRITYDQRQTGACREGGPAVSQFIDHIIFRASMRARVDDSAFVQWPMPQLPVAINHGGSARIPYAASELASFARRRSPR
jgi:hypothetical protein